MTTLGPFDGSRRHVLDWIESSSFVNTVQGWAHKHGLSIPSGAICMP